METPGTPSFIPQDTSVMEPRRGSTAGLPELMLVGSILVLVVSAMLAGAVFFYQQYLQQSSKSKLDQLNRAQNAFEPSLVVEVQRLDDRMNAAETLLRAHLAPSSVFKVIEQSTNQHVAFNSFTFDSVDPAHISIKMSGVAASVNSVALQADLFGKANIFNSPIFSGVDREQDGVHFNFSALVNPAAINYMQQTGAAAASQLPASPLQNQQQTQTQTQTSAPVSAPASTKTKTPAAPAAPQTSSPFVSPETDPEQDLITTP